MRGRRRFTLLTAAATLLLMGWGAFVTSIGAGLAVPDWPSSYSSYDPFNPWPGWWRVTPLLAEHGHRLLGMLVGALTVALAVWTAFVEPRRWLRWLAAGAVALVSFQGLLGGLRVVWLSLDIAVVHAAVAQLFLSLIVAMALFTSRSWIEITPFRPFPAHLPRLALLAVSAIYIQILLGALLRHPGTGIHPVLVGIHIGGAAVVALAVLTLFRRVPRGTPILHPAAKALALLVGIQLLLGLTAYFVTLDEAGMLQPSNLQVAVNTSHTILGAVVMATGVLAALAAARLGRA